MFSITNIFHIYLQNVHKNYVLVGNLLEIQLERINMQEMIMVEALLNSGIIGLVMSL